MSPARAVLDECQTAVRAVVHAERGRSASVKAAVLAAARRFGMKERRVEAYWWGEVNTVPAHEADAIRRGIASFHNEETARLAAELERHRAARQQARAAIRPTLQLRAPPAPIQQGRLSL